MTKTLPIQTKASKLSRLQQLKQTDGNLDTLNTTPRTIAQLYGETVASKYKTTNEEEYLQYLKNLNKSDLQSHAINCGLVPRDDKQRLMVALVREFRRSIASYKPLPTIKPSNKKVPADVAKYFNS